MLGGATVASQEGDSLAGGGGEVVPAAALIDGLASILSAGFCLPAGGGKGKERGRGGKKRPRGGGGGGHRGWGAGGGGPSSLFPGLSR